MAKGGNWLSIKNCGATKDTVLFNVLRLKFIIALEEKTRFSNFIKKCNKISQEYSTKIHNTTWICALLHSPQLTYPLSHLALNPKWKFGDEVIAKTWLCMTRYKFQRKMTWAMNKNQVTLNWTEEDWVEYSLRSNHEPRIF